MFGNLCNYPILSCVVTVSGIRAYIRDDTVRYKSASEVFPVKTRVDVTEEFVNRDVRF